MTPIQPGVMTGGLQRFGLARDRLRAVLASQAGISPAGLDALEHLELDGPLTQRQLGARLSLTSGAVTMLVDRLERAGWVRRRPHPTDRRYVLVELSPAAAMRTPPALARYHAMVRALAGGVPAEHRAAIGTFLAAVAEAAADAATEIRPARPG
ncbi:MAG TPA: MarR family transcriptional regulator [Streptosporangiaceae bacterium]|nr:MarR family transcriptional regulator [Streptosporangiaceae bacterium]